MQWRRGVSSCVRFPSSQNGDGDDLDLELYDPFFLGWENVEMEKKCTKNWISPGHIALLHRRDLQSQGREHAKTQMCIFFKSFQGCLPFVKVIVQYILREGYQSQRSRDRSRNPRPSRDHHLSPP